MGLISTIYNSPHYLDEAWARKKANAQKEPKKKFSWAAFKKKRAKTTKP